MNVDREAVVAEDRRRLLKLAIQGSAAVIAAVTLVPAVGYMLYPAIVSAKRRRRKVLFQTAADANSPTFVAARYEGQAEAAPGIFVRTEGGRTVAVSARCPHAGCAVNWVPDQSQFLCPCHQGKFDASGTNIAGPPPRPLERLAATKVGDEVYVEEPEA